MRSLGNPNSASNPAKGGFSMLRISGPGMMVFVIAFVVAVIFAANQNDVVGWVVAIIAAFWLALAAFVVFSIQKAAKKADRQTQRGAERLQRGDRPRAVVGQCRSRRHPPGAVTQRG